MKKVADRKYKTTDIKISLCGLSSRVQMTEDRISELEEINRIY